MFIDSKFANLLSDFFLDIAKAVFIASFVTPSFLISATDLFFTLFKGLTGSLIFLFFAREFAKIGDVYEL